MANKSAIKISSVSGNDATASAGSPFWGAKPTSKTVFRKVMKQVWRWTKIALFLFMMLMGLWGCFQSMADPNVAQNALIGNGLEYGFPFAQTGDYRFDLQMAWDANQYNTFTNWSLVHGPFYGFFVWPVAWIITNFMWVTKDWWGGMNTLLAIFLLVLVVRILTLAITMGSTFQNERMMEVQGQIAEINAKYKDLKDPQSKQMKQQETMALYKKYNIKPLASFQQMFLTLPIFLIIFRVVTIVRPIKVTVLFGIWNFAASPLTQLFSNFMNGGWVYIFFLLLVVGSQILTMKLPQMWAKKRAKQVYTPTKAGEKQGKKGKWTQNIFMIVMCVIVCFSAVGVGVYWFINAIFSVLQAWIVHKIIMHKRRPDKTASAHIANFNI